MRRMSFLAAVCLLPLGVPAYAQSGAGAAQPALGACNKQADQQGVTGPARGSEGLKCVERHGPSPHKAKAHKKKHAAPRTGREGRDRGAA